jgi:hypothetical protein
MHRNDTAAYMGFCQVLHALLEEGDITLQGGTGKSDQVIQLVLLQWA